MTLDTFYLLFYSQDRFSQISQILKTFCKSKSHSYNVLEKQSYQLCEIKIYLDEMLVS